MSRWMLGGHFAVLAVVAVACSATAQLELLRNGDFGKGDLTDWTWTPTGYPEPDMRASVGDYSPTTDGYGFRVNPGTDRDHLGSNEGGALSQQIDLTAGVAYSLTGDVAIHDVLSGHHGNSDPGWIRLYVGSDLLWDWTESEILDGDVLTNSFSVTYTPGASGPQSYRLLLTRRYMNYVGRWGGPSIYHYADNLSVRPGAVPELPPVCLAALGLIPLGLKLRRRHK